MTINERVELLDQYASVYERSVTGAQGWVRGRRQILDHQPEVYVEWDKSHWRYQGEQDGWSFEHHFRPVADTLDENLILKSASASEPELEPECRHCGERHAPLDDTQDEFVEQLLAAQEAAIDSSAFFIITLVPRTQGELTIYEPIIFSGALSPEAAELVDTQILYTAAQIHMEHVTRGLRRVENEPGQ